MDNTRAETTIVTVGEFIRILSEFNPTLKIVFDTGGAYASNMQITRQDIELGEDEDSVHITIE